MKDSYLILLLHVIKGEGNITLLIDCGFEFSQIAEEIHKLRVEGYAKDEKKRLILTEKGMDKINELNKKMNYVNSGQWICPHESSRIDKLGEEDVYVPDKNKINRLS